MQSEVGGGNDLLIRFQLLVEIRMRYKFFREVLVFFIQLGHQKDLIFRNYLVVSMPIIPPVLQQCKVALKEKAASDPSGRLLASIEFFPT